MKKLGYSLATACATLGLLATAGIAFADTSAEISGNGAESNNTIIIKHKCETVVDQTNKTKVNTEVTANANTGGNSASSNTGGDVTIDTGNASNTVTVDVTGGSNSASLPSDQCCCQSTTDTLISGNGEGSTNLVKVKSKKSTVVSQYAKTKVKAKASVKAKTGKNIADDNTGGTVDVTTGNGTNTVGVTVSGGGNSTP